MKKTIWVLTQAVMGGKNGKLGFATKEEAMAWYENHEYCDKPYKTTIDREKADALLENAWYAANANN